VQAISFVERSGVEKVTLIEHLIAEPGQCWCRVAIVKHAVGITRYVGWWPILLPVFKKSRNFYSGAPSPTALREL